ncbi:MAG: MFS transporter [Cyclobacteriaceae bacterium]
MNQKVRSIGFTFFISSFLFGNWVTRIPTAKSLLGIGEAELGLALLFAPIGGVILLPITGWLNKRFGLGKSIFIASLLHVLTPAILAQSSSWWMLAFGMFYFGLTNAWMDVAMNAGAAIMEKEIGRPIMSTCHGMWSLGAMVGSAVGSISLWAEIGFRGHLIGASFLGVFIVNLLKRSIEDIHEPIDHQSKVVAWPSPRLLLLSFIAFSILLGEGAIADWSALFMKDSLHSPIIFIGLAYSAFSMFMAIGRFLGDSMIPIIGMKKIVFLGSALSAFSLTTVLLFQNPWIALIGFGLTGLGFSCSIPVIFSSAANEPGYSAGAGIASVTIIGYAGFLLGPPLIGYIAGEYSLTTGFGLVIALSILATFLSLWIRFK